MPEYNDPPSSTKKSDGAKKAARKNIFKRMSRVLGKAVIAAHDAVTIKAVEAVKKQGRKLTVAGVASLLQPILPQLLSSTFTIKKNWDGVSRDIPLLQIPENIFSEREYAVIRAVAIDLCCATSVGHKSISLRDLFDSVFRLVASLTVNNVSVYNSEDLVVACEHIVSRLQIINFPELMKKTGDLEENISKELQLSYVIKLHFSFHAMKDFSKYNYLARSMRYLHEALSPDVSRESKFAKTMHTQLGHLADFCEVEASIYESLDRKCDCIAFFHEELVSLGEYFSATPSRLLDFRLLRMAFLRITELFNSVKAVLEESTDSGELFRIPCSHKKALVMFEELRSRRELVHDYMLSFGRLRDLLKSNGKELAEQQQTELNEISNTLMKSGESLLVEMTPESKNLEECSASDSDPLLGRAIGLLDKHLALFRAHSSGWKYKNEQNVLAYFYRELRSASRYSGKDRLFALVFHRNCQAWLLGMSIWQLPSDCPLPKLIKPFIKEPSLIRKFRSDFALFSEEVQQAEVNDPAVVTGTAS